MTDPRRRDLFRAAAALGVGTAPFHRAVAAEAAQAPKGITAEQVRAAEWVAGVTLTDAEREQVAVTLRQFAAQTDVARKAKLPYTVGPALQFRPTADAPAIKPGTVTPPAVEATKPANGDDLAYLPVTALGHLLKTKQVSSVELTRLYLSRLEKFDPVLKFVVSLTPDLALKQAAKADEEIAAGTYRGPLHGVPWGAKDLIAVPGYRTTWGAGHFKDQAFDYAATVYEKLTAAGAVLVAKLTLGALAMGDEWFGGMTRNPWNIQEGSSGSSAGSASAVAAGCVGFAIGSETLGSIVSPCTRCGATGLRPTFGRVSRAGCMALCFSMDKLGPIARSVADTALIFAAIHGADPADPAAQSREFTWPVTPEKVRIGYVEGRGAELVKTLKEMGYETVPVKLPTANARALTPILDAECAEAFDDITRAGVSEGIGKAWPNTFRAGRFVTAVDYLKLNRLRAELMAATAKVFETIDVYVGGDELVLTNYTGHPTVVLPTAKVKRRGADVPGAATFTGRPWEEGLLLSVAAAYQIRTGYHLARPDAGKWSA